jgi:hypothetical protein
MYVENHVLNRKMYDQSLVENNILFLINKK